MGMIGMILMVVGGIAMLVFLVQILIIAFKTSVGWGLASLLIPFVIVVFAIKYWDQCKTPFLRSLIAFAVYVVGMVVSFMGGGGMAALSS